MEKEAEAPLAHRSYEALERAKVRSIFIDAHKTFNRRCRFFFKDSNSLPAINRRETIPQNGPRTSHPSN
jgi:hypothetical protein